MESTLQALMDLAALDRLVGTKCAADQSWLVRWCHQGWPARTAWDRDRALNQIVDECLTEGGFSVDRLARA